MPDVFRLLSEFLWLVLLGFSAFNYLKAKRELSVRQPGRQHGEAEAYLLRFAVASALPWVLMGVGQISGATHSIWYYFRPQDANPFVLAWLGTTFLLSAVYAWWVLFAGGAKRVREYNLMAVVGQHSSAQSERAIKLFAAGGVLLFPVWVLVAVSMNAKAPY